MKNDEQEREKHKQEFLPGYSDTEIIIAILAGAAVSGLLGFLIGFYIRM